VQEPRAALVLLRKLLDCCPFSQAKGLLIDLSRPLFLRCLALSFPPLSPNNKTLPTEFKRAPQQPPASPDSPLPVSVPIAGAVETKQALRQIQDLKNLESYHFQLDHYALQLELLQDSHHPDTQQQQPRPGLELFFLDLFVLPCLRLLLSSDHVHDSSGETEIEIVDWISSTVSLLRLIFIKRLPSPLPPHVSSSSSVSVASVQTLIWRQTIDLMRGAADKTADLIQQWRDQGRVAGSSTGAMRKYEMIRMNLLDTLEIAEQASLL
jgi:hypothetical protein